MTSSGVFFASSFMCFLCLFVAGFAVRDEFCHFSSDAFCLFASKFSELTAPNQPEIFT